MKKIRIGIIGTSDIAFRRFLPSLLKNNNFEYVGVASRDINKTKIFVDTFGGRGYGSYYHIINDNSIDALYIPLPPALHFEWAKKALKKGKHVFLEKPFTTSSYDTKILVDIARSKQLALHENYMFMFHSQVKHAKSIVDSKTLGKVRQIFIKFGFPKRGSLDFRYNKSLGGGSLLDCGGYTIKLASLLLGKSAQVVFSSLLKVDSGVDVVGNVVMQSDDMLTAHLSFGMDNCYKCSLELWGSNKCALYERIFTAPEDMKPPVCIDGVKRMLPNDNQFYNSIDYFLYCINDKIQAEESYLSILKQAQLVNNAMNG